MKPFSLFWAAVLVLAREAWTICPDQCTCDDVNLAVTCIKAGLDTMPNTLNPALQTMVFKYNFFPTIHFSLTFLHSLVKVDLSHNKIVNIRDRAFENQNVLLQLRLESNKISQISNQTFYGLKKLKVLILRGNLIEQLPARLFGFSPELQEVDLSRNRIADIHATAFEGLANSLQILNLEGNELSSIPSEAFKQIPDLAELYLAGNPLKTVSDRALSHFRSLSVLDLSSSRLRVVERAAFRGLGTLKQLKLADNNFSSVPSEAFQNTPNLEVLDIGRNPFQVVARGSFRFLSKLKKLDLSGCGRLEAVEPQAFLNCVDLEHVTISLNRRLASISEAAFDATPSLRFLYLSDNGLRTLPAALVPWAQLKALDLSGNPWNCDCGLIFLSEVIRTLSEQQLGEGEADSLIRDGKCASPLAFRHQLISEPRVLNCDQVDSNAVRHEPSKATSSSSSVTSSTASSSLSSAVIITIAVTVLLLVLAVLLVLGFRSRHRVQEFFKAWKLQRGQSKSTLQDPYIRHHTSAYRQPSYSCDDEHYYYVATMQNRVAQGKHIPVTEL